MVNVMNVMLISTNHISSIMPHCIIFRCWQILNTIDFLKLDWAPERKTQAERYCEEMIHTGSVLAKKYFTNNHEAFNQTLRRQEVCKLLALFDILDPKR